MFWRWIIPYVKNVPLWLNWLQEFSEKNGWTSVVGPQGIAFNKLLKMNNNRDVNYRLWFLHSNWVTDFYLLCCRFLVA